MKYLIVETIFDSPHLETAAEIAINLKKKNNNKVFFSWIGSNLNWSDSSLSKYKKYLGASIEKKVNQILKILDKNKIIINKDIDITKIKKQKILSWSQSFQRSKIDLKKYKYLNQPLGLGVNSSLISFFHRSIFDTKKNHEIISRALYSSATIYEKVLLLIDEIKPDCLITFNNRFATSLPIILAGKKKKIKILRHERGSNFNKYELFKNEIHDLDYRNDCVFKYWNKEKNLKKKISISKKYFFNRRSGIPLSWDLKKEYAKKQSLGNTPIKKKGITRIVFFTASEDEHESTKFQLKNLIWPSQEKILKELIKIIIQIKNYELIIRVHPVVEKRKSYYDQYKWKKYDNKKNILVVDANSKINSYELMDTSDLVVTYGGNIAIESVFWNKKVMSLRKGIFSKSRLAFEPRNLKQIKQFLKNKKNFKNKNSWKKSLPFGYYFMVFGIRYKFFRFKDFNECYYKNSRVTHLSPLLNFVKQLSKKNIFKS